MIKTLSIRNFGSNRRIRIELDPHVTCLTGESYTGKSWVIRAIRWLTLNRPSGIRFIRWGTKQSTVRITMNHHKIVRQRSCTENSYQVDHHILKAFGSTVPDLAAKILNMSELNFQIQHEVPHGEGPLFWFALTPGQVSKRLNSIVNLDLIDRAQSNIASKVRRSRTELDICRERRQEAQEEVQSLSYVQTMTKEWNVIREYSQQVEETESQHKKLEQLLEKSDHLQTTILESDTSLTRMKMELVEIESLSADIAKTDQVIQSLFSWMENIVTLNDHHQDLLRELKDVKCEYEKLTKYRCPLCKRRNIKTRT